MNRQAQVNTTHIEACSEENEDKCLLSLSNAVCSSKQPDFSSANQHS